MVLIWSPYLCAQEFNISGKYADKNNEPISSASIEYFVNGNNLAGSAITADDGTFEMQVNIVSINEIDPIFLRMPAPNPFTNQTRFCIDIPNSGLVSIISSAGKLINSFKIPKKGTYWINWGGANNSGKTAAPGIYFIIVSGKEFSSSTQVIFRPQQSMSFGLFVSKTYSNKLKSSSSSDVIKFTKDNTSLLDIPVNTPSGDTLLGTVTGNVGPESLSDINESHYTIETPLQWYLNNYFYNDDQSIYMLEPDSGFILFQDTILQFNTSDSGLYQKVITAIDPYDDALQSFIMALLSMEYTVSIPDQFVAEDSSQDTLIADINSYKNPSYSDTLSYNLVSQSNPALINLNLLGSSLIIDSLMAEEYGISSIVITASNGTNTDTLSFDVIVEAKPDLSGTIKNIFTSDSIAGVVVEVNENGYIHLDTTDIYGQYHIQLNEDVDTITYYPVTVRHDNYTPFHTWITVEPEDYLVLKNHTVKKIMINLKNGKSVKYSKFRENHSNGKYKPAFNLAGILINQKTGKPIAGATVAFEDPTGNVTATTNANGEYSLTIYTPDYISVEIRHSSYFPFHTWYDNIGGSGTQDFEIIPDDFVWDLYNGAFRDTTGVPDHNVATLRWYNQATVHIFSDNSLVGGTDITANYDNMMYNLEFILPTFNNVEFDFNDVVEHTSFGYVLQDGEMSIDWDNSISGAGLALVVKDGPIINKCANKYKDYVHPTEPDNHVYNQELGTCFGGVQELSASPTYESVFVPGIVPTYTPDDLNCSDVRLTRTPIHYWNQDYTITDPEGFDWEPHPDIVSQYFGTDKSSKFEREFIVRRWDYDGSSTTERYTMKTIPSKIMKEFPMIFTKEEIKLKMLEEKGILDREDKREPAGF